MLWAESAVPGYRTCSGPSHPVHLAPEHFQHPASNLTHSAVMLATKGLTRTRLGNQVSIWGNEECVGGTLFKAEDPFPAQLASARAVSLPFPARCAYRALPLLKAGTVQPPAGSPPASCAAASQQFFPASQGMCRCLTFLYVVPGSLLPFPDTGVFHARLCKLPLCWVLGIGTSEGICWSAG